MDIRHLKSFIVVAEELNIGRAALRLHISQPPLTRQIQQLEQELNVQLFVRTPRGVELTQAGNMFLSEARNIRHLMEQAVERTVRAGQGKLGRLDIGIFGTGIFSVIPELLHLFRVTHPGVRVVLHTMSKGEQIEALRQKRITIGFHRMPLLHPDIENSLIINEPLYLALNEEHPLNKQGTISFRELENHPLVLFPTGDRPNFVDKVIELCSGVGFMPDISQVVGDAVTGIALVSAGLGVTIVPKSVTTLRIPKVVYRLFENTFPAYVDLSCVHRKDDSSAILHAFLAVIEDFKTTWNEQYD
ncbi:HTH-type transcriptional regulator TfdS [Rhodoferax lithotrophicus]|uniref:HTH-type transcriptional regulator TfdS n=1 Tax=Rhodoferax lithotrophicus TaxID=2798804 RepID=A0ABM7MHP9_9BURK|nr:LysR substrate-binding domain-containing protein [Rhodoferax sp. MIZ03]BCO25750.1 HTH-type transcriptional regulator TfdS [Rhodoferax sp. MIZ03]